MSEFTTLQDEINTDFEIRSLDSLYTNNQYEKKAWWSYIKYLVIGILFGVILVKS